MSALENGSCIRRKLLYPGHELNIIRVWSINTIALQQIEAHIRSSLNPAFETKMITDVHELLLFVHRLTVKNTSTSCLLLIEATLSDSELELLFQATNHGYIALDRQINSGSEYLRVELTTAGRTKLGLPAIAQAPQRAYVDSRSPWFPATARSPFNGRKL